jgi:hypothetical protein
MDDDSHFPRLLAFIAHCRAATTHCRLSAIRPHHPTLLLIPLSSHSPHFSSHSHPLLSTSHPTLIPFSSHPPPSSSQPTIIPFAIRFSSHHPPSGSHPIPDGSRSLCLGHLSLSLSRVLCLSVSLFCVCLCVFSVSVLGAPWSSFLLASVSYVGSFPFAVGPF